MLYPKKKFQHSSVETEFSHDMMRKSTAESHTLKNKALEVFQVRLFSSSPKEKILNSPHRALFFDLNRGSPSSLVVDSCQHPRLEFLEELLSGIRRSVR